jgi:RNA polymerase sigma factor for flagellar operon FliA
MDETETLALWRRFKEKGSIADRNLLVEHYHSMAIHIAESVVSKIPKYVDKENLVFEGVIGLIEAVEAFDLERGNKFETYAPPRIRGRVLDALRDNDFIPRLVRRNRRLWEQALEALGAQATIEQIAEYLAVDKKVAKRMQKDYLQQLPSITLFKTHYADDSDRETMMNEPMVEDVSPMELEEDNESFRKLLRGLNKEETMILTLYYRDNLVMHSIASLLGLSESRVSQMVSRLTDFIKKREQKCLLGAR